MSRLAAALACLAVLALCASACRGPGGSKGAQGIRGLPGINGARGIQGVQGEPGTPGASGAMGPQGPQGLQGPQGEPGQPGAAGPQGEPGQPGAAGQAVYEAYGTRQLQVSTSMTTYTTVPGLSLTIEVPASAAVYVHTDGGVQCAAAGAAAVAVDVALFVDGVRTPSAGRRRVVAANTSSLAHMIANWSFGHTYKLAAGRHTLSVRVASTSEGSATANVSSGLAPQLQGILTAIIIRQ